jgi:hypothetical protein
MSIRRVEQGLHVLLWAGEALRGDYHVPGEPARHGRSEVHPQQVQAEVHASGAATGGEHVTVIDIQLVWADHASRWNTMPFVLSLRYDSTWRQNRNFRHSDTARTSSYDVKAASTSFQRRESGIHAVSAEPGWTAGRDHQSQECFGNAGVSGVSVSGRPADQDQLKEP